MTRDSRTRTLGALPNMTTESNSPQYRIEDLEQRWKLEPSPKVLLQLAEEYGQNERWLDAAQLLEEGLRRNPGHLAAQVALGRYRLHLGRAPEACVALERVIEQDPMHLVANKLLVEGYLETGQTTRARDRLDLYALLSSGDPDVEQLEERVAAAEHGQSTTELAATATSAGAEDSPFGPRAGLPVAIDLSHLAPLGRIDDDRSTLYGGSQAEPFALPPVPTLGGRHDSAGDIFDLQAGVTVVASAWALSGAVSGAVATAAPTASTTGPVDLQTETARPAVEIDEDAPATVTLGWLYLDQGHEERAAEVFLRVVHSEPDNVEARSGLVEARQRCGWRLSAGDLLGGDAQGSADEQRRLVLDRYLNRLRRSSELPSN